MSDHMHKAMNNLYSKSDKEHKSTFRESRLFSLSDPSQEMAGLSD